MTDQKSPQPQPIDAVATQLSSDANTLAEWTDEDLSPQDKAALKELVDQRKANFDAHAEALGERVMRKVVDADQDRLHRVASGDHNER